MAALGLARNRGESCGGVYGGRHGVGKGDCAAQPPAGHPLVGLPPELAHTRPVSNAGAADAWRRNVGDTWPGSNGYDGHLRGTNPEDVAHEPVRLDGRRYPPLPDVPPGILITSKGRTVAIPMAEVTRVRVSRRPASTWAIGTGIGMLLDVAALFALANAGYGPMAP